MKSLTAALSFPKAGEIASNLLFEIKVLKVRPGRAFIYYICASSNVMLFATGKINK